MSKCNTCKHWLLPDGLCAITFKTTSKTFSCGNYNHDECWRCKFYITDSEKCKIKGTPTKDCNSFTRKKEGN